MHRVMSLFWVYILILALSASQAHADEKLDNLKSIYQKGVTKIEGQHISDLTDIQKIYLGFLGSELEKATNKGDLKEYAKIDTEKQRFEKERTIPDGSSVADHIEKAKAKRVMATLDLSNRYKKALNNHKIQLMKAKNIEGAKLVQAEIEKVKLGAAVLETNDPASKLQKKNPLAHVMQGLVLHYDFEKNEGSKVTDKSGRSNDGQVNGATWTRFSSGRNGVIQFDGKDDWVDLGRPILGTSSWSVVLWVKAGTEDASGACFSQYDATAGSRFINVQEEAWTYERVGEQGKVSLGAVSDGEWCMLAITRDSKEEFEFICCDASPRMLLSMRVPTKQTNAEIGRHYYSRKEKKFHHRNKSNHSKIYYHYPVVTHAYYFSGVIDDVMIWNRSLSEDEVKQVYKMTGGK